MWNPGTEQCCGSNKYTLATQFCHTDNTVKNKCGGTVVWTPETEQCCGSNKYTIAMQFCDSRGEGKAYKKVTIGTGATAQTWMAENLNYDVPDNTTDVCYDNDPANCTKYGRLYNWATAMDNSASSNTVPSGVQGVCPQGWHLPSNAEWTTLTGYVESDKSCTSCAGTKLKAKSGWSSNGNGTDDYGFSALPGGYGNSDGSFNDVGNYGYWWSASEINSYYAYGRIMYYNYEFVGWYDDSKNYLFSVRCLQDY
jgi:uncharacterized protein (TIGR02145 family)